MGKDLTAKEYTEADALKEVEENQKANYPKVTGYTVEPVGNGWLVTVEYDDDEYKRFTFTNLDALLSFVKDITEHPVIVPDGVSRVRGLG